MSTTQRKDSVHSQSETPTDQPIHDIAIIGAGPCGLGVAARLREKHPSALFTDVEQARYHWIKRHSHRTSVRGWKKGRWDGRTTPPKTACSNGEGPSMLVLDAAGTKWMSKWFALFERLRIEYLRSPMFFHMDPGDRDALLAFVHERCPSPGGGGAALGDEAVEICGCVGKELSKHQRKRKSRKKGDGPTPAVTTVDERDRKDYFAPSSRCFRDFVDSCIRRYGLDEAGLVRQDTLASLSYGPIDTGADCENEDLFTLHTTSGQTHLARTVVLAIGAGKPCMPSPFCDLQKRLGSILPNLSHAMDLATGPLLPPHLLTKLRSRHPTTALVIGGGLTSAQVADNLLQAGVSQVYLLMRGRLKVKPFDVDLAWMSKFQNQKKAEFWTADSFDERWEMVREARDGGSIPSRYVKRLREWEAKGKGGGERLKICCHTTVSSATYCEETGKWKLATEPEVEDMPKFDHVYLATGAQGGVNDLPFLSEFQRQYPIETVKGLPFLTDDLQWRKDVPLFVTGRMASLQLGPGAGNLEGARVGAERVVWAVEEILAGKKGGSGSDQDVEMQKGEDRQQELDERYAAGVGSKYSMLEEE